MSKRRVALSVGSCAFAAIAVAGLAVRADDKPKHHEAVPFEFVGKPGDCGTGYPAGSRIVPSTGLHGMGLPGNGDANSDPAARNDPPNKKDRHSGLLLNKNGPTADCSAAGARIKGAEKEDVDA